MPRTQYRVARSVAWRGREDGPVTSVILIRHAEPRLAKDLPSAQWPLSERGRNDATALGTSVAHHCGGATVVTSPERRASETAALAFPSVTSHVSDRLSEVNKPWYDSHESHMAEAAKYLRGEAVEGWESRNEVITRFAQLLSDFRSSEVLVVVSHGLAVTTWIDHEIGLKDPWFFWSQLTMPDAWLTDHEHKSLVRLIAR